LPPSGHPPDAGVAMTSTPAAKTITGRGLVVIGALILLLILLLMLFMRGRRHPRPLTNLQVAEAWLDCIDCQGPFLQRLHESASDNDTIVRFLRAALLQGADSARRARHERELLRAWVNDSLYRERRGLSQKAESLPARGHTFDGAVMHVMPLRSQAAFLDRYRRGLDVKWRSRAATALGVIRSDSALAALNSALLVAPTDHGDSIVQRWVERARADTGLEALGHWQRARTERDSTPGQDSTP